MLANAISAATADLRRAGEVVKAGASDDDIRHAVRHVRERLGAVLPEAYVSFLRQHDGFEFDGVVFYATQPRDGFWQGLVEANEAWRDAPENVDLLILGDDDMSFYAVSLNGSNPARHDRVTGEVVDKFDNVDDMITDAINTRL